MVQMSVLYLAEQGDDEIGEVSANILLRSG